MPEDIDNGSDILYDENAQKMLLDKVIDEKYITGTIRELDIRAANINMLYRAGVLSDEMYQRLRDIPKRDREIYIGKMIANDPEIFQIIRNGIMEAKDLLVSSNNIDLDDIVRIANDAVYVNKSSPIEFTKFGNIEFVEKNIYSSMLNLNSILLFFKYNMNGELDVDVKGIGERELQYHNGYILSVIGQAIYLLERYSSKDAMTYLAGVIDQYINRLLPIEMYRPFDSASAYQLHGFYCIEIRPEFINDVDIQCNLNILRLLYGVVFDEYLKGR